MLFLALLACTTPPEPTPMADAPPFPFAATRIRDGMPPGTHLVFHEIDAGGTESFVRWDVLAHPDDRSGTFRFSPAQADGTPLADGAENTFAWDELESHAHFPAGTQRVRATVSVGGQFLDAWTYRVPEDGETVTYTFADRLPGPPVRKIGPGRARLTLLAHSALDSRTP